MNKMWNGSLSLNSKKVISGCRWDMSKNIVQITGLTFNQKINKKLQNWRSQKESFVEHEKQMNKERNRKHKGLIQLKYILITFLALNHSSLGQTWCIQNLASIENWWKCAAASIFYLKSSKESYQGLKNSSLQISHAIWL